MRFENAFWKCDLKCEKMRKNVFPRANQVMLNVRCVMEFWLESLFFGVWDTTIIVFGFDNTELNIKIPL